ncbi:MAG TPA: rRNA adenine dimethyltransferase family protein [Candidatus Saccharimonadales bacterium]|nr:rRNA adenine dimethyltransferase family protein [Candidatus Saccharimonadales bacterium]
MRSHLSITQNFLRDPKLVKKLVAKAGLTAEDVVYDIGAGTGIITEVLSDVCREVVAVEADTKLAADLHIRLGYRPNVTVHSADFFDMPLPEGPYKVFANIPFNRSADMVRRLCEAPNPPAAAYLIVQKEFAGKLTLGEKNSQMAVLLAPQFEVSVAAKLRREDFRPRPAVDTVLLGIVRRPEPLVTPDLLSLFNDFVVYTFNAFQPSVAATLASVLDAKPITADLKPSQLSLEQWINLFNAALKHRPKLEELVKNYQATHEAKHATHTKLNRTRPNKHRS